MLVYRELDGYKYDIKIEQEYPVPLLKHISFDSKYLSLKNGLLVMKEGYAWDGISGPVFDTPESMRASLIHDALYQLMREKVISRTMFRKYADQLFRKILLEDGTTKFWAGLCYRSVRLFGKKHTYPKKKPRGKIITIYNGKKL